MACVHEILQSLLAFAGTSGEEPLQVMAEILPVSVLPAGAPEPLLQGQTQASANASGFMNIQDMTLTAVPGIYNLSLQSQVNSLESS